MIDTGDVDVFLGLDVGKGEHHGTALTPAGKRVFDKRLLRGHTSDGAQITLEAPAAAADEGNPSSRRYEQGVRSRDAG